VKETTMAVFDTDQRILESELRDVDKAIVAARVEVAENPPAEALLPALVSLTHVVRHMIQAVGEAFIELQGQKSD
jgi:hypothetical protein